MIQKIIAVVIAALMVWGWVDEDRAVISGAEHIFWGMVIVLFWLEGFTSGLPSHGRTRRGGGGSSIENYDHDYDCDDGGGCCDD